MAIEGTPKVAFIERPSGPQGWQCPICHAWVDVPHGLTGDEIVALVASHENSSCADVAASGQEKV